MAHAGAGVALLALLLLDSGFVLMDVTHGGRGPWSVTQLGSYPAILGYCKIAATSALLLGLWKQTRQATYASWAGVFGLVLLDATMGLHGRVALWWVGHTDLRIPGMWEGAPGELALWSAFGLVGLALLLAGFATQ